MGVRGRASGNQLSTRAIHAVQRPDPPERLSDVEADIWRKTVGGLAVDWFPPETLDLLECYCTHVSRKRDYAKQLRNPKISVPEARSLTMLELEQTKLILLLASKMRLTQRSTRAHTRNKHKGVDQTKPVGAARPWADDEDAEEAA
jgi:phage terminase small subunit